MDAGQKPGLLIRLGQVCSAGESPEQVLAGALPLLADLADASASTVLETAPAGGDAAEPPEGWSASGFTRLETRELPGGGPSVAFGFTEGLAPDTVWLDLGVGLVIEVLARLDAESRLADLTQRVDNAQSLANMGDYDWHIASDTNRWSDQLYRIYGHEPQSFNASYERFLSLIAPEDRERITGVHQQAYATGEPYQMIERIVRPTGELRYLSSNGQVLMDESGTPVRMRGTCIDITDRVLAEQAREQSSARFKSLVESSPDAILVLDEAGTVLQANGRSSELLGGDPVGRRFDQMLPSDPAADGQAQIGRGLDGRSLVLDVSVAALTEADDAGVTAVFLHDATQRLERESMAAGLREAQVRRRQALEINDNIVQGLSAAVYSFEIGDQATSSGYLRDTLASAKQMMSDLLDPLDGRDLQPGELVRSTATTFTQDAVPDVRPAETPDAAPVRARHRVLIVDDYDDMRMLLRIKLEQTGLFEVVGEASNGEQGVELATQMRPDVVLLDLAMPLMDGLQALPLIREAVEGIRVVVLSGFDQQAMASQAMAAGADRYVEKGLAMSDLVTLVQEVLGNPNAPAMS